MKTLEKNYDKIFFGLLLLIASTLIFRAFSTIVIWVFIAFNLLFYKKLTYDKRKLWLWLLVASPFLLDILFFWNNNSLYEGLKSSEKRLSFIIFPTFLLGYHKAIDFKKLLKCYAFSMVIILLLLYVRYAILNFDHVLKYLHGIHLWELGYDFGQSFGMHAPALNMHLAFVSIVCLYLFLNRKKGKWAFIMHGFFLVMSFFIVMYVNTRVALGITLIGYAIVCFFEIFKNKNIYKALKITAILFGVVMLCIYGFVKVFPYSVEKFTEGSFSYMEYVGRLDDVENPEAEVFSKLVTRVSIWKATLELAEESWLVGYGASDSRNELINYYKKTDQKFLAKYEFPVHNQYLDFLLKFGILGIIIALVFMLGIGYIGLTLRESVIISFFFLFFISNLTDDFLIRFDGITFSALWYAIFANRYFYNKINVNVEKN